MQTDVLESQTPVRIFRGRNEPNNQILMAYGMIVEIVLKEPRETRTWLLLIQRKSLSKRVNCLAETVNECSELIAIFRASINTAEYNKTKQEMNK